MPTPPVRNSSPESIGSLSLTRRELIAGAGAGAAALLLDQSTVGAQVEPRRTAGPYVFTNTTVANPDLVQNDVALAVENDRIAAIGPTDALLARYPQAEV